MQGAGRTGPEPSPRKPGEGSGPGIHAGPGGSQSRKEKTAMLPANPHSAAPTGSNAAAGLGLAVAALVALSGCSLLAGANDVPRSSAGAATETAKADAFKVRVGDCLAEPAGEKVDDVTIVPCSSPHYLEAFAATKVPDAKFPGEQALIDKATEACKPKFKEFAGVDIDSSVLGMTFFYPTTSSWKLGDREIICLAAGADEAEVTGTLKGSRK